MARQRKRQRKHVNDISIGEDQWIETGSLKDLEHSTDIGPLLADVMPFFEALETNCVADCCGIQAFDFWSDQIENTVRDLTSQDRSRLLSNLARLQGQIAELPAGAVGSRRLNQHFRKDVFLDLLKHIQSAASG